MANELALDEVIALPSCRTVIDVKYAPKVVAV
jgi:hypothetical protein